MPATPVWLAGIEGLLNRNIAAATQGERLARRLNGRSLQVDALGLFRLRATTVGLRLILQPGDDTPADAVISGSPPALLKMLTGASAGPAGQDSVQVRGDAEVAAFYRELLTLARRWPAVPSGVLVARVGRPPHGREPRGILAV
jgi:ubiquinone biosynthesis protein UbiJ